MGADGSEGRAIWPAVIGHQTSIGRNDVAGTQCRIISNSWVDEAEGVPAVAGAAGDDLLPVRERGGKLRVALAVWRDRVLDAVAVVDLGFARRTKRAAGLRRTYPAMTLGLGSNVRRTGARSRRCLPRNWLLLPGCSKGWSDPH